MDMGIKRVTMLTGDRSEVANRVAGELGCTDYKAQCLPQDKLAIVEQIKKDGHTVVVVGDGINDAPALAAGDLGIAMGAAGSDVAINSASIALMNDDLRTHPVPGRCLAQDAAGHQSEPGFRRPVHRIGHLSVEVCAARHRRVPALRQLPGRGLQQRAAVPPGRGAGWSPERRIARGRSPPNAKIAR